jgi:hypothetical protein
VPPQLLPEVIGQIMDNDMSRVKIKYSTHTIEAYSMPSYPDTDPLGMCMTAALLLFHVDLVDIKYLSK